MTESIDIDPIDELTDALAALWRTAQRLQRKYPEIFAGSEGRIETAHKVWMKHSKPNNEPRLVQSNLASDRWIRANIMPDFDGDYLCHISRRNDCGTFSNYQKVVSCSINMWIVFHNELVTDWRKLPDSPDCGHLFD